MDNKKELIINHGNFYENGLCSHLTLDDQEKVSFRLKSEWPNKPVMQIAVKRHVMQTEKLHKDPIAETSLEE